MTSSYCYAQVRVRRFGEPALPEPSWPDGCGTMPEYNYQAACNKYVEVGVLNSAEKVAFASGRYTSHGKPPVVYKELVVMECESRTFGRKVVRIVQDEGDPTPTSLEAVLRPPDKPPDEFKDAPVPFKRWWGRYNERAGELFWSAFQAGRELGRDEGKEAHDAG